MHKLKIYLDQNAHFELFNLFAIAHARLHSQLSIGQFCMSFDTLVTLIKRAEKFKPINGLVRTPVTLQVYQWELILLLIAKANIQANPYNQITINEVTEKIHLFNMECKRRTPNFT